MPALTKDQPIERDNLWWLHEGHRAIRVGDWKLVAAKGTPWELYNLKADRAEQQNLADKMPEKVQQLEQAWQQQTEAFTKLARESQPIQGKPKAASSAK